MQDTEAPRQSNYQNSIILLTTVDFYAETFPILYPCFENSTTGIAIINVAPTSIPEARVSYVGMKKSMIQLTLKTYLVQILMNTN